MHKTHLSLFKIFLILSALFIVVNCLTKYQIQQKKLRKENEKLKRRNPDFVYKDPKTIEEENNYLLYLFNTYILLGKKGLRRFIGMGVIISILFTVLFLISISLGCTKELNEMIEKKKKGKFKRYIRKRGPNNRNTGFFLMDFFKMFSLYFDELRENRYNKDSLRNQKYQYKNRNFMYSQEDREEEEKQRRIKKKKVYEYVSEDEDEDEEEEIVIESKKDK
eukprot:TRINITY_DN4948_c0_g1_i1.p1 TRINITY_DN4948_c0_g1~~TRINITY_DN4948_c0_g1_i1.p1  ORF type:complete len:221 (-),score=60.76 TRINITY_DN4948_c0_g1_i1:66-728(-)